MRNQVGWKNRLVWVPMGGALLRKMTDIMRCLRTRQPRQSARSGPLREARRRNYAYSSQSRSTLAYLPMRGHLSRYGIHSDFAPTPNSHRSTKRNWSIL